MATVRMPVLNSGRCCAASARPMARAAAIAPAKPRRTGRPPFMEQPRKCCSVWSDAAWKLVIANWQLYMETGSREAGIWKLALTGSWKLETGNWDLFQIHHRIRPHLGKRELDSAVGHDLILECGLAGARNKGVAILVG